MRSKRAVQAQEGTLCTKATRLDDHGQPRYTLHQLHHTRGTEMIAQRSPVQVVQKTLGHVDPRSTPVYADVRDLHLRHE